MTQHEIILHLSLCAEIGPVAIQKIIAFCGDNLVSIYRWTALDWQHNIGLSEKNSLRLVVYLRETKIFCDELQFIKNVNAQWMSILDERYPIMLRSIYAPPPLLYWFGSVPLLSHRNALAVIGSRAANAYGESIIQAFVPTLVQADFCIVSGGALGADSMAHRETLKAGGKTIVVLGSGLSCLYPRTNIRLFKEVIERGGTVVTSFPMNFEALPSNFPSRNRIIAGLSRGCLVVQAAEKSGTRITAHYALQQGREVFVVPGTFDDPLSAGCHLLAQEGAMLVTSAAQICKELGVQHSMQQKSVIEGHDSTTIVQAPKNTIPEDMSLSARIICAVKQKTVTTDELVVLLQLDHDQVQQQLWDLQWAGKIQQNFTGRWYLP